MNLKGIVPEASSIFLIAMNDSEEVQEVRVRTGAIVQAVDGI